MLTLGRYGWRRNTAHTPSTIVDFISLIEDLLTMHRCPDPSLREPAFRTIAWCDDVPRWVAASAASKRLSDLEDSLKTRFLKRSNRGIEPTAVGAELHGDVFDVLFLHPTAIMGEGRAGNEFEFERGFGRRFGELNPREV